MCERTTAMAVSLDAISIEGFKSYLNDQAFHFPKDPGLYMLTGPAGSGKTAFFDAIRWGLEGRDGSPCWIAECHTAVSVDLVVDGELTNVGRHHVFGGDVVCMEHGTGGAKSVKQCDVDQAIVGRDVFGLLRTSTLRSGWGDAFADKLPHLQFLDLACIEHASTGEPAPLEQLAKDIGSRASNYMSSAGLTGWSMRWFDFMTPTRKVFDADGRERDSTSSGHATLIRIAVSAAFADLARSRLERMPDFELWDDPCRGLGEASKLRVMEFLRERAHEQGLKIWVADADTRFACEADSHWRVRMDHMGSHIEPG